MRVSVILSCVRREGGDTQPGPASEVGGRVGGWEKGRGREGGWERGRNGGGRRKGEREGGREEGGGRKGEREGRAHNMDK